jgi:hypothetical protein
MAEIHKSYHPIWQKTKELKKVKKACNAIGMVLSDVKSKKIKSSYNAPEHILIEGDNYHALSIFTQTHYESIDLIYIDRTTQATLKRLCTLINTIITMHGFSLWKNG